MRHMKTVKKPAIKVKVIDRITCDFCGATIEETDNFSTSEIHISYEKNIIHRGRGDGIKTTYDCCEDCWNNKLTPVFLTLGAKPTIEEWSF